MSPRDTEMQYGYFDDANREYVITRPDTPRPWSNYLGSADFGGVITNNDYIKDMESGDFWTNSWFPVASVFPFMDSILRYNFFTQGKNRDNSK